MIFTPLSDAQKAHSKYLSILLRVELVSAVIPFLMLIFYNHPSGDDFSYAREMMKLGFWKSQLQWYNDWQGRYSSTAILSIYNSAFGLVKGYWVAPLIMFAGMFGAVYFLIRSIGAGKLSVRTSLWGSLFILVYYVTRMPSPCQGFYWLSGSVTYQLSMIVFILLAALLVNVPQFSALAVKVGFAALCVVLSLFMVGLNESIMPVAVVAAFFGCVLSWQGKVMGRWVWTPVLVACVVGSAVVILAPGNSVRASSFKGAHDILNTVLGSLGKGTRQMVGWSLDSALLAASIIYLPVAAKVVSKLDVFINKSRTLRLLPAAWLVMMFLFYVPAFWSMNARPPWRTINIIHLFFILGWFMTITIAVSAFPKLKQQAAAVPSFIMTAAQVVFVLALVFQGNFHPALKDATNYGRKYNAEMNARYTLIEDAKAQGRGTVTVPLLKRRPKTIFFSDITDDFTHWKNTGYATVFGLQGIALVEPYPDEDTSRCEER